MTLTLREIRRVVRIRAMLGEPFDSAQFRALLWAELDAWEAARTAAAWGALKVEGLNAGLHPDDVLPLPSTPEGGK
jgi:hypothetical protein